MVDVPHSVIVCRWSVNFCVAAILAGPDHRKRNLDVVQPNKINGRTTSRLLCKATAQT